MKELRCFYWIISIYNIEERQRLYLGCGQGNRDKKIKKASKDIFINVRYILYVKKTFAIL